MIKYHTLDNGIRVVTDNMPGRKVVSFGVFVKVGSACEDKTNNGISHAIEHCVFKGTKKRTSKQLAEEMEALGDQINAYTGKEMTAFYGTTLSEYLEKLTEILSDIIINPLLEEEAVKKELGVILEEIDMYDDSPDDLVHELLEKDMWKNHPLGFLVSGEKKVVSKFTSEQLREFKDEHYYGKNMVISVAGNFDEDELLSYIHKYFDCIPKFGKKNSNALIGKLSDSLRNNSPYRKTYEEVQTPAFRKCFVKRSKDIEQLYLNIAFNGVNCMDDRRYAVNLLNDIFGGSEDSLLFQEIREELGLAYSVYSYNSSYTEAGLFRINMTVNPSKAVKAYKKALELAQSFKLNPVSEKTVEKIRNLTKIELIMASENTRGNMEANARSVFLHGRSMETEERLERYMRVTADDINEAANSIFDLSDHSICLVGAIDNNSDTIEKLWRES